LQRVEAIDLSPRCIRQPMRVHAKRDRGVPVSESPPSSAGRHREVVAALVRAGAEVQTDWLSDQAIQADPAKVAALRGKLES
jgi:hypothetical protein